MADATAGSGNARMIVENQNQNRNRNKGEVKLIILSYMRSGSTFTGDLFNQHPEVLYFYEPLWSFDFHFKKGRALSFPNGRSRIKYNESDPKQLSSLQEDTLRSIFSCQFTNVNHRVLGAMAQTFSDVHTRRLQDYARCYRRYTNWQDCWRNCLWKLLDVCQASRVTVVKTLRLGMAQALNLLEADPGVKVVHLVRDPRGILNSRQVTGIGLSSGETAGELCSRVLQDVRDSVPVRTMYPGRILTVRYEDLTADPLGYAEHLLKFTGLDFSPEHRQYVWNITSTKENIRKRVGSLQRGDSKSTATTSPPSPPDTPSPLQPVAFGVVTRA
ncbi:carbohydrate sulfotransferase 1-like [Babylonia areolata]|uniref:carbohydrate sulfotransferase 1-like n=1 Tax=Babylonia areolata TaxID=304850 RepID=UPI003FD29EBE